MATDGEKTQLDKETVMDRVIQGGHRNYRGTTPSGSSHSRMIFLERSRNSTVCAIDFDLPACRPNQFSRRA